MPKIRQIVETPKDFSQSWEEFERHIQAVIEPLNAAGAANSPDYGLNLESFMELGTAVTTRFLKHLQNANPEDIAQEVVQDFMLKILTGEFSKYFRRGTERRFVPIAVLSLKRDCLRKVRDSYHWRYRECGEEIRDPDQDPAVQVERRELHDRVAREINNLPPLLGQAFLLTSGDDGLTSMEAASLFQTTVSAINNRTHRARAILKARLSNHDIWPLD